MAFTGRWAVKPGDMAGYSSSDTGKRMLMSSGVSPSTSTRQPVSRRSHAGSRSVVIYQLARKRSSCWPPLMQLTVIRWAATVPASMTPAAISTRFRATACSPDDSTESIGTPMASATSRRDGPKELAACAERPALNGPGSRPKPSRSKIISGEFLDDMSANSSMVRRSRRR